MLRKYVATLLLLHGCTYSDNLYYAAEECNTNKVSQLLASGADPDDKNRYGKTALYIAAGRCYEASKLLIDSGADVNATDYRGVTPLMMASEKGEKAIVQLLISHGANLRFKNTKTGADAVFIASQNGHTELVNIFLDIDPELANSRRIESDGMTSLMAAAGNGHHRVVETLVNSGAALNERAADTGNTAIMLAAGNGHTNVVSFLLTQGADPNIPDSRRLTPLMSASYTGHMDIVKLLVSNGADINAQLADGGTALGAAKEGRHKDIERYLKKQGAK